MLASLANVIKPSGKELMNPGPELVMDKSGPASSDHSHGIPLVMSKMLEVDVEMKDDNNDDVNVNCSKSTTTSHGQSLKENEVLLNNYKDKIIKLNNSSINDDKDKKRENRNRSGKNMQIQTQNKKTSTIEPIKDPEVKKSVNSSKINSEPEPEPVYDNNNYKWELDAERVKVENGWNYICLVCKKYIRKKVELFFHRCKFCLLDFFHQYARNTHAKKCTAKREHTSKKICNQSTTSSEKNQSVPLNRNPIEKINKHYIEVITLDEPKKTTNDKSLSSISRENKRPIKLTYKAAHIPTLARQLKPFKNASKSEENLESIVEKKSDSMARLSEQIVKKIGFEKKTEQYRSSMPLSLSPPNRKRRISSTNGIESNRKLVISISKLNDSPNDDGKKNKTGLITKKRKRKRSSTHFQTKKKSKSSLKLSKSQQNLSKVQVSPPKLEYYDKGDINKGIPVPRERNTDAADIIKALEEMGEDTVEEMHLKPDTFSSNNEYYAPSGTEIQGQNMFSLVAYQGEDMGFEEDLFVLMDVNGKIVTFDQVQIVDDDEYDEYMAMDTCTDINHANASSDYQMDCQGEEGELFPCMWCEKVFKTMEFKDIHEKISHSDSAESKVNSNSSQMQSSTLELDYESDVTDFELGPPPILDLEVDSNSTDKMQTDSEPADKKPTDSNSNPEDKDSTGSKPDDKNSSDREPTAKNPSVPEPADKNSPTSDKNPSHAEPKDKNSLVSEAADKNPSDIDLAYKKATASKPIDINPIVPESEDKNSQDSKTVDKMSTSKPADPSDTEQANKKALVSVRACRNRINTGPENKKTTASKTENKKLTTKKPLVQVPETADKKPKPATAKLQLPSNKDKQVKVVSSSPTLKYKLDKELVLCIPRINVVPLS